MKFLLTHTNPKVFTLELQQTRVPVVPYYPDLSMMIRSRSGLSLVDDYGSVNTILTPEWLGNGVGYFAGDKTRASERLFDGGTYTIYCKYRLVSDASESGAEKGLFEFGQSTINSTSRGVQFNIFNGILHFSAGDGTNKSYLNITYPTLFNATFRGQGYFELFLRIDGIAKTISCDFYKSSDDSILGTSIVDLDISSWTFNNDDNEIYFRPCYSDHIASLNFKKFSAIKSLAQCRDDSYLTDLQIHQPLIYDGTDVSGNAQHFNAMAAMTFERSYGSASSWLLDHGCSVYTHIDKSAEPIIICNSYAGSKILRTLQIASATVYGEVATPAANLLNHNLTDSKIRFTDAFFDRSNATIWKSIARADKRAVIALSGTSGTASVTVNGITATVTWRTNLFYTAYDFVYANAYAFNEIGITLMHNSNSLIFETKYDTTITEASIINLSLTLNGTATKLKDYDSSNTKDFYIRELNQRSLINMLNVGYKGKLFVEMDDNSIEEESRTSLQSIFLYTIDKSGINQKKIFNFTGDIIAAVLDEYGAVTYDSDGYLKIGEKKSSKPMMTLRYDDSLADCFTGWKPLMDALGLVGVNAILPLDVGTSGTYLSWVQVQRLLAAGWEICNHGVNENWTLMTKAQIEAKLILTQDLIESYGITCKTLIPHGVNRNAVDLRDLARQYYRSYNGHIIAATEGTNPAAMNFYDWQIILGDIAYSYGYDMTTPEGVAAAKAQIDIAIAQDRYLVFTMHAYTAPKAAGWSEVVAYAIAQGIDFVTIDEALNNFKYL